MRQTQDKKKSEVDVPTYHVHTGTYVSRHAVETDYTACPEGSQNYFSEVKLIKKKDEQEKC